MTEAAPGPDPRFGRRPEDLAAQLDARLHRAAMLQRHGLGPAEPVTLRHWRIDRRLGRGGMGAVYLAFDRVLARPVALKLLALPPSADLAAERERVHREARALAAIEHPNVVRIHQVHLEGDTPILEMEHIDGPNLRAWQAAGPRSWRAVVAAYAAAGDGVAALHRAGLVHRDLKPDNILIGADGVVRLVDLGLAARPAAGDGDDAPAGTFGYIAPEVFAGADTDPRSDQYSLCVALHEALYGVRPFHGDTPAELARAIGTGRRSVPDRAPRLPAWLVAALTRGLQCDRDRRHTDMNALVRALRRGLARRRTWTRRAVLAVAVSGLVGLGWLLRPDPVDPCAATDPPRTAALLDALRTRVATDPPARRALAALTTALDRQADAWTRDRGALCRDARRDDADLAALRRRLACLDARLDRLLAVLGGAAAARDDLAAHLLDAAAALDQLPDCADPAVLARWPVPERSRRDAALAARLTAALHHETAGDDRAAEGLAREVAAAAVGTRHHAEALYRLGHILGGQDRSLAALAALDDARNSAEASGADELKCRIVAYRAKLLANVELDVPAGRRELAAAEACAERTRTRAPLLRADMLEARGLLSDVAGLPDHATACHEEALHLRRTHLGERHMEVSKSLHNLGNALASQGRPHLARRRLLQALELRGELVGPGHPRVADILYDLGHLHRRLGDDAAARDAFERASAVLRAAGGAHAPGLADLHLSLAELDLDAADAAAAASHLQRARQLQAEDRDLSPVHPQRAVLLGLEARLHESRGDLAAVLRALTAATQLLRAHDPHGGALASRLNEVPARHALGDFAGVATFAREAGPALVDHLRERPAGERGPLAWYIGDSLLRRRAPAAATYLELALTAYREQNAAAEVAELRRTLADPQPP
jgi:hypothetical protein